ncbi:hypothetical protein AB0L63_29860 [Nocardia sp. NPDC051990]|uniref:hypothetical protein n=1 Tax=Nocardia sp. NPDC051990 TaxID=3155285 RepID=UPI003433F01C
MDDIDRRICQLFPDVRWTPSAAAFIASSDEYPGLTYADECSSLAAIDGLECLIRHTMSTTPAEPAPHYSMSSRTKDCIADRSTSG